MTNAKMHMKGTPKRVWFSLATFLLSFYLSSKAFLFCCKNKETVNLRDLKAENLKQYIMLCVMTSLYWRQSTCSMLFKSSMLRYVCVCFSCLVFLFSFLFFFFFIQCSILINCFPCRTKLKQTPLNNTVQKKDTLFKWRYN